MKEGKGEAARREREAEAVVKSAPGAQPCFVPRPTKPKEAARYGSTVTIQYQARAYIRK
jgi:hypothetical protein